MINKNDILNWLQEVQHPAKEDQSVVALGLVDKIEVADGRIHVTLGFPKRPDPLKNYLVGAVQACLYRNAPGGTEIEVDTVVTPPSRPPRASSSTWTSCGRYPISLAWPPARAAWERAPSP